MNVIITGASSGIGRSTALELLKFPGLRVVAISRNSVKLSSLQEEAIRMGKGEFLRTYAGDITSDAFISMVAAEVEKSGIGVQVLINNAGKLIHKAISELSREEWREVYDTNVFSTAAMIKYFLPLLKQNLPMENSVFQSHILNIGSVGGVQGSVKFAGLSAYSSSKGAMSILTECLAEELKSERIAVNCLALGSVQTEMFTAAFPGMEASMKSAKMGQYIAEFAMHGHRFYNGKVLPVTFSTP
ncbi:MAG: SDR family NAD(P)-dependent oxidoreductase [Bacteroidetes bacterium]|nr:SDR family NAD(P)-dependent oxidoreductase [Bacteroidota bacterium]